MNGRALTLIAAREVREALRARWFLLAALAFLGLSLALAFLGLAGASRSGLAGYDRTTASLLNLVLLFVPMAALPLGGLSFAGELEDGALAQLLAQPVTRTQVWMGKFLGLLVALGGAVLLGFGLTGILLGLRGGGDASAFAALVGLVLLLSAVLLALGLALGAWLEGRARVLGASFALWLGLVYLADLGAIGLTVTRGLEPGQVFALSLLNPVSVARVLGTLALSDRLDVLGPAGLYALDRFGAEGVVWLAVGLLLAATLGGLLAGRAAFQKTVVS